jgi:uncharacterized protein (TIGR02145 family)
MTTKYKSILRILAMQFVLINVFSSCQEKSIDNPTIEKISDIDGNSYKTIVIGNQEWMTENLKTTKLNDGNPIPIITNRVNWNYLISPALCWYNNDASTYKNEFGALYNWYAVGSNKLCPAGWHVPTLDEWKTLESFLGGSNMSGTMLKSAAPRWDGTNSSGFSAVPGGHLEWSQFEGISSYAEYWSATLADDKKYSGTSANYYLIQSDNNSTRSEIIVNTFGLSVRCLKGAAAPSLSTSEISNLTANTATCGGTIIAETGLNISERGICWSESTSPTIANSKSQSGSGVGTFSTDITGLNSSKSYYVRSYAISERGATYGNERIINPKVGKAYCTGVIFYIDATGQHGLVGSSKDLTQTISWGCNGTIINGADGIALGTGSQNTTDIINSCSEISINDSPAARICKKYTGGGYNDWYLPSQDELYLLYLNKTIFVTNIYTNEGGFETSSNSYYWSSSEFDNSKVWVQNFYTGNKSTNSKYGIYQGNIRAIRSF